MPDVRYAGITYASVAGDRGSGGWQVHARSPELTAEDERTLTEQVVTGFDSHLGPLPQFVEPESLAGLPVRFSSEPAAGGTIIRHASQAGSDVTGRPGNVFTTVLLDRAAGTPPHPIRLWRSPDLRTPFGAAEIADTVPRWDVRPGSVVDAAAVAEMVTDPSRWALLAVLLDAVASAVSTGRTVVLRVPDQDEAAHWVGAVCLLTAPAWSAGLSWSLYERGGALEALRRRGVHLVCVSVADDVGTSPDVVVLDADEQPTLGVLGGSAHITARGVQVEVSAWSDVVTELFPLDAEEVARLLHDVEGVGGAGPVDGHPAWWLAAGLIAAVACPADVAGAASGLLLRLPSPSRIDDRHRALLDGALDDGPRDPGGLRAQLAATTGTDARAELLGRRYVEAALADLAWLDTAEPAGALPLGTVPIRRDVVAAALRSMLTEADGGTLLRRLTNVLDVLASVDLLEAADPTIDEPLSELVLMAAAELDPERAPSLVASVNRLPERVRADVLPMLAQGPMGAVRDVLAVALPAGLGREGVLRLLDASDGLLPLAAADALLARGPDRAVARRVGALLAAREGAADDDIRSLHLADWDAGDRLALAAALPGVLPTGELVLAVARAGSADVRLLAGRPGLPGLAADALHLRFEADRATADRHWPLEPGDDHVLRAADRLAGAGASTASVVLGASMRLLPVVALLARRWSASPGTSAFEGLLKRQRPSSLEPLAVETVAVLADRLADEDQLIAALAYAASDRTSSTDEALRLALRTEDGDLLDLALAATWPSVDPNRRRTVLDRADERSVAPRPEGRRLERLLQRRSPVAEYLDDRGLNLPRKVR